MMVKKLMSSFRKVWLAEREEKHSIPNFKSTLVKLFQSIIYVNTLCLVAKTSLTYELV